jgi:prophage antirepressor-like protein
MSDLENQIIKISNEVPTTLLSQFPEFQNIEFYGTVEDPLVPVQELEKILQCPDIRLDKLDLVEGEDYIKVRAKSSDCKIREQNMLTERGLYTYLARSRTALGKKFNKFVYVVLKELRLKGQVTLKTAVEKLKQYDLQLEDQNEKLKMQTRLSEKYFEKNFELNTKLIKLEQQHNTWNKNDDSYKVQRFRELLFKPLYVYVDKVPRKLQNMIDSYDEDEELTDSDVRLMSVSFVLKNKSVAATYYVPPGTKLETVQKYLEPLALESLPNKYHCSLEDIDNYIEEIEFQFIK